MPCCLKSVYYLNKNNDKQKLQRIFNWIKYTPQIHKQSEIHSANVLEIRTEKWIDREEKRNLEKRVNVKQFYLIILLLLQLVSISKLLH